MWNHYSGDLPHFTLLHDTHAFLPKLFPSLVGSFDQLCLLSEPLVLLDILKLFLFLCFFKVFFLSEILVKIEQDLILVAIFHSLLKNKHLVANIIAHFVGFVFVDEFLAISQLKNHLALFVCTLVLLAPFFMFSNIWKQHKFITKSAGYLQNLDELFQNMWRWPHSLLPRALDWTVLRPFRNACFAEHSAAVVALHRINKDF